MYVAGSGPNHVDSDWSSCENFSVNTASLGINTTVHSDSPDQALVGNLALNGGAHDSASVTGKVNGFALPDVTFYFFARGTECTNGDTSEAAQLNTLLPTADGLAHPSTSETGLAAGDYNFMAVVAGNDNYTGSTSNCEPFTVGKASLGINTTVHSDSPTQASVIYLPSLHDALPISSVTGKVNGFALPDVTFYFFA